MSVLQSLKCDCLECIFVFIEPYLKASTSLTHICLNAIGAFQFVHSGFGVYVWYQLFVP